MEDFHVAKFIQVKGHELGLFAIFDGHLGDSVPAYLQKHLFANILKEVGFFSIFPFLSVLFGLPEVGSLVYFNFKASYNLIPFSS